jgi:chemotaxis protein MotB
MPENNPTIIVIRKKRGHGGHHGGAWKVAYADFVTAMMALFIVLWLLSSSEDVKKAVGGYFSDPTGSGRLMGSAMAGSGESLSLTKDDMGKLKEKLESALNDIPKFKQMKDQVQLTVTGEGLRVELMETDSGMFFNSGSARPSDSGEDLIGTLAKQMGELPNDIVIEGHTDSKPFNSGGPYSNWELSSDRANAARRIMLENGLRLNQVKQVRGFADQQLRVGKAPDDASNRRVTVIVRYMQALAKPEKDAKAGGHSPAAAKAH